MVSIPRATTRVQDQAGVAASGLDVICVWSPCAAGDDLLPRLYGSAKAIYDVHGYCEGVEYAALHEQYARKPILFMPLPVDTLGAVSRENKTGNTGTSVTTVTAGGTGVLAEHDGAVRVVTGGTIGTDQILLEYSADGQRTWKKYRLGTANSFAIPFFNVTMAFAAGTLVAGDVIHTWHGSAPRAATADWATARANLAAQQKGFRSILNCQDLQSDTEASAYVTQLNAYETENERFVYGRASVYDRKPFAEMSRVTVRMTTANVTFAEVGATADTITRATGSFITDGFAAGMRIDVSGSASNNFTNALITGVSALVLTLDTQDLVAEGPVAGVTITGSPAVTFAEVGATGDTITRSSGSWLTDGFRVGDLIDVNASSNDFSDALVTGVTATVLTLDTQDLAAEVSRADAITISAGQTKAQWMAEIDAEFSSIDDQFRVDLAAGRGRALSPFSGWFMRRSPAWAASIREYQHDLHIATWRKSNGPFDDFSLTDEDGILEEWDDRVDGEAASAARFTSFRTWANGQEGTFITLSLTRAEEGSLLGLTHNVAVVNLACTTVQLNTEDAAIGVTLILNSDGTATADSLAAIKSQVDNALELALLTSRGEGQRASFASWEPDADVLFNVPTPTMTGTTRLLLNGTVHSVTTAVQVQTAG